MKLATAIGFLLILMGCSTTPPAPSPAPPIPAGTHALSLHIGLNSVDPRRYANWSGYLPDCELDANNLEGLARSRGFTTVKMLTQQATSENITEFIHSAAQSLKAGDIFLLTYSGHGGQRRDANGDEDDGWDETLCLWNRMLSDDEIAILFGAFKPGVRVVCFFDSCHSGTVSRSAPIPKRKDGKQSTSRRAPQAFCEANDREFKDHFALVKEASKPIRKRGKGIRANILTLGGCQDHQESQSTGNGGAFTLSVLNHFTKAQSYRELHQLCVQALPPTQIPSIDTTFAGSLADEKPFHP